MPTESHRPLCTIELIAEGHADRCTGEACSFWEDGCMLSRVESDLGDRPEVAAVLLELRRDLDAGRTVEIADAQTLFHRRLGTDRE